MSGEMLSEKEEELLELLFKKIASEHPKAVKRQAFQIHALFRKSAVAKDFPFVELNMN
jgi:ribosomal protein L20A (L18A)